MEKDRHLFLLIYRWLNTLSLDVCLGAIAGGIMATRLLDTRMGWAYWLILPAAVWLIYTADHLMDGYSIENRKAHFRHRYHRKNARTLIIISILISLIAAFLSFSFLPFNIILFGIILGVMTMIYLAMAYAIPKASAIFMQKELLVALFYTAGIWGPVIITNNGIETTHALILLVFLLLAFEDLIMLSMIEIRTDKLSGQGSLPIFFGYRNSLILFYSIAAMALSIALTVYLLYQDDLLERAGLIMILMQAGLIMIFRLSSGLSERELYRYLSEAIFFMPALMLL